VNPAFAPCNDRTQHAKLRTSRHSADDSEYVDSADDSAGSNTDPTEIYAGGAEDGDGRRVYGQECLFADERRPPEHYLQQLEIFDETEYAKEYYKA
jgi:hypothetical protein